MIKAIAKDYELKIDGKKEIIHGDVWIGNWEPDGTFLGAWFTKENGKLRFSGEVHMGKQEFDEHIESWIEI